MDYYEDRKDPSKDIGKFAFRLLCRLLASNSCIVVSTFLLYELEAYYTLDQIRGITIHFEKIMEKVEATQEQKQEAAVLAEKLKVPKGDALHAVLARDNNAVLVSRDKHFQLLKSVCEVVKPEDII